MGTTEQKQRLELSERATRERTKEEREMREKCVSTATIGKDECEVGIGVCTSDMTGFYRVCAKNHKTKKWSCRRRVYMFGWQVGCC